MNLKVTAEILIDKLDTIKNLISWPMYSLQTRNFFLMTSVKLRSNIMAGNLLMIITAWKVSVFGVILVCIFAHSDWIRRDTEYLSVFWDQNNSEYEHFLCSNFQLYIKPKALKMKGIFSLSPIRIDQYILNACHFCISQFFREKDPFDFKTCLMKKSIHTYVQPNSNFKLRCQSII